MDIVRSQNVWANCLLGETSDTGKDQCFQENLQKSNFFLIRISSENRLKYLGRSHVSGLNYATSIKLIFFVVYNIDVIDLSEVTNV